MFANVAAERGVVNVLAWEDRAKWSAKVISLASSQRLQDVIPRAGELLYEERVVFVEGPSDEDALRLLAGATAMRARWVRLRQTDAIAPEIAKYFRVIAQAHGTGLSTGGMLILDGDKREKLEKDWGKPEAVDPRTLGKSFQVVWSCDSSNDLESNFCNRDFLAAYFASLGVVGEESAGVIDAHLANVKEGAPRPGKGCIAVRALHAELLGEHDLGGRKADDLLSMIRFFLHKENDPACAAVRDQLRPLRDALVGFLTDS